MAPSRSGTIRSAIGPSKAKLRKACQEAAVFKDGTVPEDIPACEAMVDQVELAIKKLRTSIDTILTRDQQWQLLAQAIEDYLAHQQEEALYNQHAWDSKEGYLVWVDTGNDMVQLLEIKMNQINRKVEEIKKLSLTPPPGGFTPPVGLARQDTAKLPKLTLPKFAGDYLSWPNFWSVFDANVHSKNLSGVEKFSYLRNLLEGTALDAIDGMVISNDSYPLAVDILRKRFERSATRMVGTLYGQLKKLPVSSEKLADIRRTHDNIEKLFRQLTAAGENVDSNRSLALDVLSKYPAFMIRDLQRRKGVGVESSLATIRSTISDYLVESENLSDALADLECLSFVEPEGAGRKLVHVSQSPKSQVKSKPSQEGTFYEDQPTSSALSTFTPENTPGGQVRPKLTPKFPCGFCNQVHFMSDCKQFPTRDIRVKELVKQNKCLKCFAEGHQEPDCKAPKWLVKCFLCKTSGEHRTPLCPLKVGGLDAKPATRKAAENSGTRQDTALLSVGEQSLLQTAYATVYNPVSSKSTKARLIFDNASHRSYITEQCAHDLKLDEGCREQVAVATFGAKRSLAVPTTQVEVGVVQRDGTTKLVTVHTTSIITNCPVVPNRLPPAEWEMVQSMKYVLADVYDGTSGFVDILIGSDYFWEFLTGSQILTPSGLYLIPSTLGLLLGGRCKAQGNKSRGEQQTLLCITETNSCPGGFREVALFTTGHSGLLTKAPDIDNFWMLETVGIVDCPIEKDDEKAMQQFNQSILFQEGRYQVKWPWKPAAEANLPSNYELALGRFRSLAKRLRAPESKELLLKYHAVIDDQLKKGIIEKVALSDQAGSDCTHHYLPHHPVLTPGHATTKLRVVYDASAKTRKEVLSLNECLYRGPVLLPDLCQMLIRFRLNQVAIIADIEKAFLQLSLQLPDRDVTRFLWFEEPGNTDVENNTATYRFCRVPFGVISSPFLLSATIRHHLSQQSNWVSEKIIGNIYVDNVISGTDTEVLATEFYDVAKSMFSKASMNLREWASNSKPLMDHIPEIDRVRKETMSVLGLDWNPNSDSLRLKSNWPEHKVCESKRAALHSIASVFDPLGLFQPCLLPGKLFLKELWDAGYDWDKPLNEDFRNRWRGYHEQLTPIFDVQIPRFLNQISAQPSGKVSLVVFCDASIKAYAAVAYLRTESLTDRVWESNLIFSKSRLAPRTRSDQAAISLPRLELLGLLIGSRVAKFLRQALPNHANTLVYLFSDSQCALQWVTSDKALSVFVSNRVAEIRQLGNCELRYVQSADNPADFGTRGMTGHEILDTDLWWRGPPWLRVPDSDWPTWELDVVSDIINENFQKEVRKSPPVFHTLVAGEGPVTGLKGAIDINRFSSLSKLLRVTVLALKFLRRIWKKLSAEMQAHLAWSEVCGISDSPQISAEDVRTATNLWVRSAQEEAFTDAIGALVTNKRNQLVDSLHLKLDPDGVIRCHGRLEHADLPEDAIRPKLLPKDAMLTRLVIREVHGKLFHAGISHTLSQVRRQFWIPHGRVAVRKVISSCLVCRKHRGPPFALPRMPPWPKERVSRSCPFKFTGLDYLGPINVKVGGEVQKMWICLFTCLAVRAIHLEWVSDCSAQEFLNCLTRFISRRGTPQQIISDNAPQFKVVKTMVDRVWHKVLVDNDVQRYIASSGIRWKFITELSPWQGGFYERLVGVVKTALKAAIGRRLLDWQHFITLVTEVEAMVNSRPMTFVHSDFSSAIPLRLIDFLTELPVGMPAPEAEVRPDEFGSAGKNLLGHWKHRKRYLDALWEKWYDDYLICLRERGRDKHRGPRTEYKATPQVNQIVVVKEADVPRGSWKLARIIQLIEGSDGKVRSAVVRLPNRMEIKRSVSFLYPLEIEPEVEDQLGAEEHEEEFDGFTEEELQEALQTFRFYDDGPDAGPSDVVAGGSNITVEPALQNYVRSARRVIDKGLSELAFPVAFEAKAQ